MNCTVVGASWFAYPGFLGGVNRFPNPSSYPNTYFGFRLALLDTEARVYPGGSWYSNPKYLRSAYRSNLNPSNRRSSVGLRLALGGVT